MPGKNNIYKYCQNIYQKRKKLKIIYQYYLYAIQTNKIQMEIYFRIHRMTNALQKKIMKKT